MAPADALSRLPRAGAQQPKEGETDEEHIVAAITRAQAGAAQGQKKQTRKRTRTIIEEATQDKITEKEEKQLGIQPADISKAQEEDSFCGPIMEYLRTPGGNKSVSVEIVHWSRHMMVEKGLLWHQYEYQGNDRRRGTRIQLVVPTALQKITMCVQSAR